MSISSNNTEIYYLLEKANVLFSDFMIDHVVAFDHEDDFLVVIYTHENRNFTSFVAENYLQYSDALPSLLGEVQEYDITIISVFLIEEGIKLIENKMHSKNNARFYFDAH